MESAFLIGNGQVTKIEGLRGETPSCLEFKFKRGDVVRRRRLKCMVSFPDEFIVVVAIPPGFSPDWALADLIGDPRPLMAQVGSRFVTYILVREGDSKSYLIREKWLLPTNKPTVEIGSISKQQ